MSYRLFLPIGGSLNLQDILDFDKNTLFFEDNFANGNFSLFSVISNTGGATSALANLPATWAAELYNVYSLSLNNTIAATRASRSTPLRGFVPGKWKATIVYRMAISSVVSPVVNDTNNTYYYIGWGSSTGTELDPAGAGGTANIFCIYDALGLGIRTSNNGGASTVRPSTPQFLTKDVVHEIKLVVDKFTPKVDLYVDGVFIVSSTVNLPQYNNASRSMGPFIQIGRVAADAVNLSYPLIIDKVTMLLEK